jgi:hypothetical protein
MGVLEFNYHAGCPLKERLKLLLRYAILAPSSPNNQPREFAINDGGILVFAGLSRALPFVDPGNRALYMGVGCAIANLCVAGTHFGFASNVRYFPPTSKRRCRFCPAPALLMGMRISSIRFKDGIPPKTDMKMR